MNRVWNSFSGTVETQIMNGNSEGSLDSRDFRNRGGQGVRISQVPTGSPLHEPFIKKLTGLNSYESFFRTGLSRHVTYIHFELYQKH